MQKHEERKGRGIKIGLDFGRGEGWRGDRGLTSIHSRETGEGEREKWGRGFMTK